MEAIGVSVGAIANVRVAADVAAGDNAHALEVLVAARLLRRHTPGRVEDKQTLEQVVAGIIQTLESHGIVVAGPAWERLLVVREVLDARPLLVRRRAEGPVQVSSDARPVRHSLEDLEDLVDLGVAGEQRLARGHLGEYAADGPHVDAGRVLAASE
jgi:hypothetical protein